MGRKIILKLLKISVSMWSVALKKGIVHATVQEEGI
jgi:hypothetical protein